MLYGLEKQLMVMLLINEMCSIVSSLKWLASIAVISESREEKDEQESPKIGYDVIETLTIFSK